MNGGDGAGVSGAADSWSASSAVSQLIFTTSQWYQYIFDQSTPLVLLLAVLTLMYALREYLVEGFKRVTTKNKKLCLPLLTWQFQFLFPDEMLYEVFLRLPVKSLLRYRSVSEGMRLLIDSSIFIRYYNIHRSVKFSEIAAARSHSIDSPTSYSDNGDDNEDLVVFMYQSQLHRFYSLSFDNLNNLNRGKVIELECCDIVKEGGFSKGFGCRGIFGFLKLDPHRYILWNPTNDTSRNVDCSSFAPFETVSMGYDNVNDDYKIIGFITRDASSMQVYSFRTDSWRTLCHRDFPSGQACDGPVGIRKGVCVGIGMHWMWTTGNHDRFIIAFNLATERFTSSLPLPSEARQLQQQPCHFTDFRGCLCVIFVRPGDLLTADGPHTIWVMKKYGVESSWCKLYNYKFDTLHTIPNYCFPNNRGRLLCCYRQLSWWDPQQGTFEKVEIPELSDAYPLINVRNLVRLDRSLV